MDYKGYSQWIEKEKIKFWDEFLTYVEVIEATQLLQLLKNVIICNSESIFCRRSALNEMFNLTINEKIKERKFIAFLLDDMDDVKDSLLQCLRLKYLTLFYVKERKEIEQILEDQINNTNDLLIQAEAKYQYALIMLFNSISLCDKKAYIKLLSEIQKLFFQVTEIEENRIDAKMLSVICEYIVCSLDNNKSKVDNLYKEVKSILWEATQCMISEHNEYDDIYISLSYTITRLHKVVTNSPDVWLNYKEEFEKLCSDFYVLSNISYKKEILNYLLVDNMQEKLKKDIVEPVFRYNYTATLSKINVILLQPELTSATKSFLEYLKELILSKEIKYSKFDYERCKNDLPMLTESDFQELEESNNLSETIYRIIEIMDRFSPERLLKDIIFASIRLQSNYYYIKASEDERNDFIRDILDAKGYDVKDQTRRGVSHGGKASGEIDILIQNKSIPYSIYEALNLDSLDKAYLGKHINKIYKYDTLGCKCNFVVSYVSVVNFKEFWNKYKEYIKQFKYPYPLSECDEEIDELFGYSDVRIIATTHIRNGNKTILYHICIKIQKND